jgi:hypothetical protein
MEELVLLMMARVTRKQALRDDLTGEMILSYGLMMRLFSLLMPGFFLILIVAILATEGIAKPGNTPLVIGLAAIALLASFPVLEAFGVSIRLGDQSIIGCAPWRLPRTIDWNDIQSIKYSHSMKWFLIEDANGSKIRVSILISGLGDFATEIRNRLQPAIYQQAKPGFDMVLL